MDSTLFDGKSGSLNRGDKEYMGFTNKNLQVLLQMEEPKNLSQVTLSFLEDVEKGVLAPEYLEVWGGDDKKNLKKLGELKSELPKENKPSAKGLLKVIFPEQSVKYVRIIAKNAGSLPGGHSLQETNKASIFIDEVALE